MKLFLRSLLATAILSLMAPAALAQQVVGTETVVDHGDPSNRYDIVIVGEGYTQSQIDRYHSDVQTVVGQLRSTTPYKDYFNYLNVHRIDVVSKGSGISVKDGKQVDSGFGTVYAPNTVNYLRVKSGRIQALAAAHAPDADAILCIMNGAAGGRSYGKVCVASNLNMPFGDNVAVHELGHTIAKCADEYSNMSFNLPGWLNKAGETVLRPFVPLYGGFEFLNVTSKTGRKNIPWSHWLEGDVALPTAESDGRTGLYEGAFYFEKNWYRPVPNCLMRNGKVLCPICNERTIIKLSEVVVPYAFLKETKDGETVCRFESIVPGPVRAYWFLDGKLVSKGYAKIRIKSENMKKGRQTLKVEVQDATALVRKDDEQALLHSYKWELQKDADGVRVRGEKLRKDRDGILGWFQARFNALEHSWPELYNESYDRDALVAPRRLPDLTTRVVDGPVVIGATTALANIAKEISDLAKTIADRGRVTMTVDPSTVTSREVTLDGSR